ncbi:MAG: hypothetical protein O2782_13595 [bacterium]|nr:hypothetical protein [bacterium]
MPSTAPVPVSFLGLAAMALSVATGCLHPRPIPLAGAAVVAPGLNLFGKGLRDALDQRRLTMKVA